MCLSYSGNHLVAAHDNGNVCCWDAKFKVALWEYQDPGFHNVYAIDISFDDSLVS